MNIDPLFGKNAAAQNGTGTGASSKVLQVINSLDVGGAQLMMAPYLEDLGRTAYASTVLSLLKPGIVAQRVEAAGASVHSLEAAGPSSLLPAYALRLPDIMRRVDPDLIHGWMYHGNITASVAALVGRRRTPVIWGIHHSVDDIGNEKFRNRLVIRLLAKLSSTTAAITYCSRVAADQHEQLGFDPDRRVVIPNGMDSENFTIRPDLRHRLRDLIGAGPGRFVAGNIARFHPMKDQVSLVRAIARVAAAGVDVQCVFIGADHEKGGVVGAARKLGIADRITILGVRDDVAELLPGLDVCVQSSAWGEAFSLSLGEAMACGVPSVATDVGDTALLLGREGVLVPPREPDALAHAILRIARLNPAERAALGLRARQRVVNNFSLSRYVARHRDLYAQVLADDRRRKAGDGT
jgi:glycosyltransferase involved in cell wall biosynthesis